MQIEKINNNVWHYKNSERYFYIKIDDLLAHWLSKMPNTQNNNGLTIVNGINIEKIFEYLIEDDTAKDYNFFESDLTQFRLAISQLK